MNYDESPKWILSGGLGNLTAIPEVVPTVVTDFSSALAYENFISQYHEPIQNEAFLFNKIIDFEKYVNVFNVNKLAEYYAGCSVHQDKEGMYPFLVRNVGAMAIYVNGKLADWSKRSRGGDKPQHAILLNFSKGANFVVVKIMTNRGRAAFSLEPKDSLDDAVSAIANEAETLLYRAIIAETDSLELSFGAEINWKVSGRIYNWDDSAESERSINFSASNGCRPVSEMRFVPGLYTLEIRIGEKDFNQMFCVGEPLTQFYELKREICGKIGGDASTCPQVAALIQRMEILIRPENIKKNESNWQLKVISVLEQLARMNLAKGNFLFDQKGLQLRAFESTIDGQTQVYRIFTPSCNSDRMPLVIYLPVPVQVPRPFIESVSMAAHIEALKLSRLAEEAGVAILWPGYRTVPLETPSEISHVYEVLDDVGKHFSIDTNKITIIGACESAVLASMLAVDSPKRFAGVVYMRGVFHRNVTGAQVLRYLKCGDFKKWMEITDPVAPLLALANDVPKMLIYHDGTVQLGHGDLALTTAFRHEAKQANVSFEYWYWERQFGRSEEHREIFRWCAKQVRINASAEPHGLIYREHNAVGPISRVFEDAFVLVIGTGGTAEEQAASKAMGVAVSDAWRKSNFGDCLVMRDSDVTDAVLKAKNLVLVGNAKQNSVWMQIVNSPKAKNIPKLQAERIIIDGREWRGADLMVYAVSMNPFASARRVVFIGMDSLKQITLPRVIFPVEGWFDFALWDCGRAEPELVTAEEYKNNP